MLRASHDRIGSIGYIGDIRGNVIDAHFSDGLPNIHNELRCGVDDRIVVEVESLLDAKTIRGIALTPIVGLARTDSNRDLGRPVQVPVGTALKGRMLNLFGQPIDHGDQLVNIKPRLIHAIPPPLTQHLSRREVFQTGIKAIDLLTPLDRGGKSGLFGRAGVGKTVLITELIYNVSCSPLGNDTTIWRGMFGDIWLNTKS